MDLKKLTLLHSNDMHGDFLAENIDDKLVGGVSMLSGFIAKTRAEERNVIYAIAGDMFRGSVIDSEYKGLSTIEIMNMLAPDVVTIGNHEADYGLAHLLFLEKCAGFPIVNANLRAKPTGSRLFTPCHVLRKDGLRILFITSSRRRSWPRRKRTRISAPSSRSRTRPARWPASARPAAALSLTSRCC